MIKTIYLVKRNPGTTYDEFVANWQQHAVLSGSFPEVQAVRLGHPVQARPRPAG